jgi:hypothetical protein
MRVPPPLLFAVLMMLTTSISAAPVHWNLVGVNFDDGATASGSFTYDADTNEFSGVSVVTTDGVIAGSIYTDSDIYVITGATALILDIGENFLTLFFESALSNSPDTINLIPGIAFGDPACNSPGNPCNSGESVPSSIHPYQTIGRLIVAGTVSSVPIPAAVWLFGSGLGLLGWFRRRQAA